MKGYHLLAYDAMGLDRFHQRIRRRKLYQADVLVWEWPKGFWPHFWNSMTWMNVTVRLKNFLSFKSYKSSLSLRLNTRETSSGRSWTVWCDNNSAVISGQKGLQVIVMNRSGLPQYRTIAIASWYSCHISHGPPLNDEGRMDILPTSDRSLPCRAASTIPWYTSDRSFSWLKRR